MRWLDVLIVISSLSFFAYGISWFTSQHMKNEFKRFGLEKFGLTTVILEIAGASGLVVGLFNVPILLFSSGGLSLLMFLGVVVRLKIGDGLFVTLPAFFFMILNSFIFYKTIFT